MLRGRLLRFTPCLLAGLAISLAEGDAPAATVDLKTVSASITIERVGGIGKLHQLEVRLVGTGITSATITPPQPGATAVTLTKPVDDFVATLPFASEDLLFAAIPNGTYRLDFNSGSSTVDINFTRLGVPSPKISAPDPLLVQPPGPIAVKFTACPVCSEADDSVVAKLEQGASLLATAELSATANAWTPSDAVGPLELAEDSAFTVRIIHTAVRETALGASGSDSFTFRNRFVQSDAVAFETGFAPPEGALCIVANETTPATLDPAGECLDLVDLELAIVDPGGSASTVVHGMDVDYGFHAQADGKLSGVATADLDGDGFQETTALLEGHIRGKAHRLRQQVKFRLGNAPPELDLKVGIEDRFSIPTGILSGVQVTRGVLAGAKLREEIRSTLPVPYAPLGWRLDFEITDGLQIQDASILLENGRRFALRGKAEFDLATDRSYLDLASRGADAGVRVSLRNLAVDDVAGITTGKLGYKILGQTGATPLR